MNKPVILLTATIHCDDTPFLKRRDPEIREADYRWAIKAWMNVEGYDTLIFCENSGADLSRLETYAASINKFHHRLIFLSCKENAGAQKLGKGYGEMQIIRHAIDALKDFAPEQLLLKSTGRLRARNATLLLSRLASTDGEIFCFLDRNLTLADSRVFAITLRCAREHLLPRQDQINDFEQKYFEHALSDAVHGAILAGSGWSPLPCDPRLYGTTGSTGERFGFFPHLGIGSRVRHFLARKVYWGNP